MKRLLFPLVLVYGVGMTCFAGYLQYQQWSFAHHAEKAIATDSETSFEAWIISDPIRSSSDPPLDRQPIHVVRAAEALACFGAIPLPSGAKIVRVESSAPVWARVVLDTGQYFVYDFIGFTPPGCLPDLAEFEVPPLSLSLKRGSKRPAAQAMAIGFAFGKEPKEPERLYCSFRSNERPLLSLRNVNTPKHLYSLRIDPVPVEWVASTEFAAPFQLVTQTIVAP